MKVETTKRLQMFVTAINCEEMAVGTGPDNKMMEIARTQTVPLVISWEVETWNVAEKDSVALMVQTLLILIGSLRLQDLVERLAKRMKDILPERSFTVGVADYRIDCRVSEGPDETLERHHIEY